ncbi:MAG: hypothetical protein ACRCUT_10910 [Spirochaetota bacterium]
MIKMFSGFFAASAIACCALTGVMPSDLFAQGNYNDIDEPEVSAGSGSFSCFCCACTGGISQIVFTLWYAANLGAGYKDYPYAPGGRSHFILYSTAGMPFLPAPQSPPSPQTRDVGYSSAAEDADLKKYSHYYAFSGGCLYSGSGQKGWTASVRGRFIPYAGPFVDIVSSGGGKESSLTGIAALCFPLFQYDFFSPDLYGGYALSDFGHSSHGAAVGCAVSSFPVRPVILYARAGVLIFGNETFRDYQARIGCILRRGELYAGYRYRVSPEHSVKGYECGVTLWL